MDKPREFWIDSIINIDRPNQKTAYIYEQDADDKASNIIHVIEKSAYDKAIEALKFYADSENMFVSVYENEGPCIGYIPGETEGDDFDKINKNDYTKHFGKLARKTLKELGVEL